MEKARRPLRTLLFSSLYPSAARPTHGIFVETRLRELLKSGQVETKVVAPVPWFPFNSPSFGEYARFAATPSRESRNGVEVFHPRYFLPPKFGMSVAPHLMAMGALPTVKRLIREGFDFDLIDAHYYYPDGVAASFISKALGKPFVVTARGTDLNLIPQYRWPRRLIMQTAQDASASIGVCRALMTTLRDLGADERKLHTLRNGVDLERFRPEAREESIGRLGLQEFVGASAELLVSVGHLIERKGHHLAIEALPMLDGARLAIVGEGPERNRLMALSERLGVASRVHFAGAVRQDELKWWYSAASALVLCSSREGWANVLLEAMACGTPVVATNIWGTPEVVTPKVGVLMKDRTAGALVDAWTSLRQRPPEREAIRDYAEGFSWAATTAGQLELFSQVVARPLPASVPGVSAATVPPSPVVKE